MSPRKEKIRPVFEAQVEKLDAEGRGVARRDAVSYTHLRAHET